MLVEGILVSGATVLMYMSLGARSTYIALKKFVPIFIEIKKIQCMQLRLSFEQPARPPIFSAPHFTSTFAYNEWIQIHSLQHDNHTYPTIQPCSSVSKRNPLFLTTPILRITSQTTSSNRHLTSLSILNNPSKTPLTTVENTTIFRVVT